MNATWADGTAAATITSERRYFYHNAPRITSFVFTFVQPECTEGREGNEGGHKMQAKGPKNKCQIHANMVFHLI